MESSTKPIPHRTSHNLKKANWELYTKEIEGELSKRRLPTDCENGEILEDHHSESSITPHTFWKTPPQQRVRPSRYPEFDEGKR